MDSLLQNVIGEIEPLNPFSIFLYGSRAGDAYKKDSDYEIGVVFEDDKYVNRSRLHAKVTSSSVKAYPFKKSELIAGTFDTPFQKTFYLREIIEGGRIVFGPDVLSGIPKPPITTLDLIQTIRFEIGYSLAAVLSMRSGDKSVSHEEFSKSCLYGVRCWQILELQKFEINYRSIFENSQLLPLSAEQRSVINAAYSVREGEENISADTIFDNISLLNHIEREIVQAFNTEGNQAII